MKRKFSKNWKNSKQPRKQRKFLAKAPIHIKRKMISSKLSKELKQKYKRRSVALRKGDKVLVMKGKFKKKEGKISEIKSKSMKVYIEGLQIKKQDGSKISIPFRASNLKIIDLNLDDKKRIKKLEKNKEKTKENKSWLI